ncbi:MAG: ribosome biogenesis GTP-binding protein YihA/YsxC [Burkholderiaceae bacterium]
MRTLGEAMAEKDDSESAASTELDDDAKRAKAALAWAHTARFLDTASQLDQLPVSDLPEIAFVGRSNAGKSSAINALTQQNRLAFASKTPGRTQHINLFALGPRTQPNALFVDLPGYGYAAVARSAKQRWQQVMAQYLEVRRSLSGLVLLVDSRLGATELDLHLLEFIEPRLRSGTVKLLVLLTKVDKLNRSEVNAALKSANAALAAFATEESDIGVSTFSVPKNVGVTDVAQVLHAWVVGPAGGARQP